MSKILVTGGSGFLGSSIMRELIAKGHDVVCLDIVPPREPFTGQFVTLDAQKSLIDLSRLQLAPLEHIDSVIHLLGKNIFGRFTPKHKQAIYNSRIVGSRNLCELWENDLYRPRICVSASAVGYYGNRREEVCNEFTSYGDTFLSHVVVDWEYEILKAQDLGVRVVCIRNGHVLGVGGLLGALLPLYKKGLGGPLGNGQQWMPWIHISDLVRFYIESIEDESYSGVYLGVAPHVVRNREFSKTVANILKKPHIFFIPHFALRLMYGEFADEMMASQRAVATRGATADSLWFTYPELRGALADIFK